MPLSRCTHRHRHSSMAQQQLSPTAHMPGVNVIGMSFVATVTAAMHSSANPHTVRSLLCIALALLRQLLQCAMIVPVLLQHIPNIHSNSMSSFIAPFRIVKALFLVSACCCTASLMFKYDTVAQARARDGQSHRDASSCFIPLSSMPQCGPVLLSGSMRLQHHAAPLLYVLVCAGLAAVTQDS